jgi:hypothetical protein
LLKLLWLKPPFARKPPDSLFKNYCFFSGWLGLILSRACRQGAGRVSFGISVGTSDASRPERSFANALGKMSVPARNRPRQDPLKI